MRCLYFTFCLFINSVILSQNIFYQDIFNGGISSSTYGNSGYGIESNGTFINDIPPNSTIRKAFLFVVAEGNDSLTIRLDGKNYFIDSSNSISSTFLSFHHNSISVTANVYCVDLSNVSFSNLNSIPITIPDFSDRLINNNVRFTSCTLVINYDNSNLPIISTSLIMNEQDVDTISIYNINNLNPINNHFSVSLSTVSSYICQTSNDGSHVFVNNNPLGLIGGKDNNTVYDCSGIYGCFAHYNNTSYGLDDDTSDSLMNGSDGLSDIKNYIIDEANSVDIKFINQDPTYAPLTNPIRYLFLAHSTKCDTLHSYSNISDTTICSGEPLELFVGGDSVYTYKWRYKGNVVSADSILNIAPEQNRIYSVLVSDTSGCSKTEIINVKVKENPNHYNSTQDAVCPNNNGVIVIDSVQGIAPPYRYNIDNGTWQTAPVFANLSSGSYDIGVIDTNGCLSTELITINTVNNVVANFDIPTSLPPIPITIDFNNQSQNATAYQWFVNGLYENSQTDLSYLFESDGEHVITLIASKTNGDCPDTLSKTLTLVNSNYIIIPSIWEQENMIIQNQGNKQLSFILINGLGQTVLQRKQTINNGTNTLFGETSIAKGIYYYQVEAIDEQGITTTLTGKILRL